MERTLLFEYINFAFEIVLKYCIGSILNLNCQVLSLNTDILAQQVGAVFYQTITKGFDITDWSQASHNLFPFQSILQI